jgi:hypothetical protein
MALPTTNAPEINAPSITTLGNTSLIPCAPLLPLLVLPSLLFIPLCPFDVASTEGSTVAVFWVFVYADVEKVVEAAPLVSVDWPVRNTRANPGAGTGIWQVLAF